MHVSPTAAFQRPFLDLALRRARPAGAGSAAPSPTDAWVEPALALGFDLGEVTTPYVVVGGVATARYLPGRTTLGLDILVLAADAPALHRELEALGLTELGPFAHGGTVWQADADRWLIALESDEPWAHAAVAAPVRTPGGLPVVALPYLVLMKLAASRPQDLADIGRMLGAAADAALETVRDTVGDHRPQDRDDLESLIALGRLEFRPALAEDSAGAA